MSNYSELLSQLTVEEKAGLCSGKNFWETKSVDRLGIPSVMMTDGPHGMRKERADDESLALKASELSTCFPTASCSACCWDTDLLYKMGEAIAKEAQDQHVSTVLGPGVNIKRSSLCGRNFEYFSEDPYLAGKLSSAYIRGVQSQGIGTSLKHFAANNQEYLRMSISSVIDDRTLHEIYLRAFEISVREAQPRTVMCSYNRINGVYSSDNKWLLTDVLRDKWGFEGIVVSDWGATDDRVQGIRAGLDLEMPYNGGTNDAAIVAAVAAGELAESELDICAKRVLGFVDKGCEGLTGAPCDYDANHELARRIAADSMVLLKNDNATLPLAKSDKLTIIGGLAKEYRHQGSGSSRINCRKLVSVIDALTAAGIDFEYCEGYKLSDDGCDAALLQEAVELSTEKDKVLLVVGLTDSYESEGYDRRGYDIPKGHNDLIQAVLAVNPNVSVLTLGGSPFAMPWFADVKSVLNAYLAGEAGGEAIVDVLFGDVNPSGKLAETWALDVHDNLADIYFRKGPQTVEYREGIFVGYRYFDSAKKAVRFPFGYGLSYTTFAYGDAHLSTDVVNGDERLSVTVSVTNNGKVAGKETVQIYVHSHDSVIFKPERELKGFAKVALEAGETKDVTIELDDKAFSFYNVGIDDWQVGGGEYDVLVCASSRDVKKLLTVTVTTYDAAEVNDYRETAPSFYNIGAAAEITDTQFVALYGKDLPDNTPTKKGDFNLNSTIMDIRGTFIGKIFTKFAPLALKSQVKNVDQTTLLAMQSGLAEIPIRAMVGMSNGIVPMVMANGIVDLANGKRWRGLRLVLKGACGALKNVTRANKETKKANAQKEN